MVNRKINLQKNHSFFLLGPRQTGKSTLLRASFPAETTLYYDLLKSEDYHRLSAHPELFRQEVESRDPWVTHVVIDEVQRIPDLLNEVHRLMEGENPPYFVMSGSSARKLKKNHANLLAGRAWTYRLYPLTHMELGASFSLEKALRMGTLPSVYLDPNENDALKTLRSYSETYLKEEIEQEALVRNLGSFLRFLPLAATSNACVINYSNISREIGVSYHTVKDYFKILEDTMVGYFLHPYSKSIRRRLAMHPKFYFFDTGACRTLTKQIYVPLEKKSPEFGSMFESFIVSEVKRIFEYSEKECELFFYRTSGGAEVDLIIEYPDKRVIAVEIKATENPDTSNLTGLRSFKQVSPEAELFCCSLAPRKRKVGNILILPWQELFKILHPAIDCAQFSM